MSGYIEVSMLITYQGYFPGEYQHLSGGVLLYGFNINNVTTYDDWP